MFVNDKIVYLQLQKTGCTHIARLLTEFVGGSNGHKHGRINCAPDGRVVIGSVRNPWDWYVSLWAYGCMGRGAIHARLTTPPVRLAAKSLRNSALHPGSWLALPGLLRRQLSKRDTAFWRRVYKSPDDAGAFRAWIQALHDPEIQGLVFEDSRLLPLHESVGLYSARLVYLYSNPTTWDKQARSLGNYEDLCAFFEQHSVIDRIIRTETLNNDLADLLQEIGHSTVTPEVLAAKGKTNASKRADFASYYDPATIRHVADRDRLITELYDYSPPALP